MLAGYGILGKNGNVLNLGRYDPQSYASISMNTCSLNMVSADQFVNAPQLGGSKNLASVFAASRKGCTLTVTNERRLSQQEKSTSTSWRERSFRE